jgi:hypothetical protein
VHKYAHAHAHGYVDEDVQAHGEVDGIASLPAAFGYSLPVSRSDRLRLLRSRRCLLLALSLLFGALVHTPRARAESGAPWFLRVGLGGGYGGIGSEEPDDATNNVGPALAWDGAAGAFVNRYIALHGSLFGHFSPDSVAKYDQAPRTSSRMWTQNFGAGFTLAPPSGFCRVPRLRAFLSMTLSLAVVDDQLMNRGSLGVGSQLLLGFDVRVRAGLHIGLALQGSYAQRGTLEVLDGRTFSAGHAAGLLTFSYDSRRP